MLQPLQAKKLLQKEAVKLFGNVPGDMEVKFMNMTLSVTFDKIEDEKVEESQSEEIETVEEVKEEIKEEPEKPKKKPGRKPGRKGSKGRK